MARSSILQGMHIRERARNITLGHLIMALVAAVACFIILYPLLTLIIGSFQRPDDWGDPLPGYTLENYRTLLLPRYLQAIWNTLILSVGACFMSGVLGVSLAWLCARTNSFAVKILEPVNLVPFYVSPLIGSIAWTYLAAPSSGFLNVWAKSLFGLPHSPFNIYSMTGMIWVMGLFYTPVMYLFTVGSFQKMDPALEEAARTAGAGNFETTLRVTIPLMLPSILFGMSLNFVTSMGLFGVPAALGFIVRIMTLSTSIYAITERATPDYNMGAALGMVILAVTLLTFFIQRKVLLPREFTTVTGKGYRPTTIDLGKWRYVTFLFHLLFLLASAGLPIFALVVVSLSKNWLGQIDLSHFTLEHYLFVLQYPLTLRGIRNSLFLSFVGATLGMAFCLVLSYIIHKLGGKAKGFLDFISTLPVGMPSIVLSIGILIAYIKTPLYGTIWILMLAYITRYIPVGVKNVSAVLLSISQELEDGSKMCGAKWLTTMRRILIPLLKPGLLSGWMLLFLIFMRELNASVLLYSQGNEVMAVILWILMENAPAPQIAAYSMLQVLMMLVIMFFVRRVAEASDSAH